MIIRETKWVFIGVEADEAILEYPFEDLTEGQIVTILEPNISSSVKLITGKFLAVNNETTCIISNAELDKMFVRLEDWRNSKIKLIIE